MSAYCYAALGWPVFPIPAGQKRPVVRWGAEATTDGAKLAAWRRGDPASNWGAAMGARSGVWALDIDGDDGRRSLEALLEEHGKLPRAPCQRTGGGGYQVLFAWPMDREVRNSASKVARNVDVRGEGGFIVVPPSIHPSGNRYRWLANRAPWEVSPPPAPSRLLDLVSPLSKPRAPMEPPRITGDRYGVVALERAVAAVMCAGEGARNSTLNAEAFSTSRLVLSGHLGEGVWREALATAAGHAGLTLPEIIATLDSALRSRLEAPR